MIYKVLHNNPEILACVPVPFEGGGTLYRVVQVPREAGCRERPDSV